ncbi:hypothetical protein F4804DRAFT_118810 [Jackrogersella minutella]|nr:hypothetical protein F4804DRAFT_118810 [Jackrogersella minutella]
MALDFLTIHPMSSEYERLFSAAGRMVTPLRKNLDAPTIGIFFPCSEELDDSRVDEMNDDELAERAKGWLNTPGGATTK